MTMTGASGTAVPPFSGSGDLTLDNNLALSGNLTVGGNKLFNVETVVVTVQGTGAATAANYGVFFIAPVACTVTRIDEVHRTAGSDGGAVNLQVERLQGVEAKDAGDALLTNNSNAGFDLKGTAETVQNGTLAGGGVTALSVGDRLGIDDDGTLTSVAHVCVTVSLKVT